MLQRQLLNTERGTRGTEIAIPLYNIQLYLKATPSLTFHLLLNFVKKVPLVPLNLCGAAPVHVLRRGYFFKMVPLQSPLVPLLFGETGQGTLPTTCPTLAANLCYT